MSLAIAFALVESKRESKKITGMSFISLPFWAVQVSEASSIILNAFGETQKPFELTENTALGSVKRLLSSETTDAKAIPEVVNKALPLLGKIEKNVKYIRNLESPHELAALGSNFVEIEPGVFPNRLDTKLTSQDALQISEGFQSMVQTAITKIGSLEEIQKIAKDQLEERLVTLENVILSEKQRWEKRARTQEEIEGLEIAELTEKKRDQQYKIEENYRIAKRVLTSEFARDTSDLEMFFSGILGRIQEARLEIGHKADDFKGAVELFKQLIEELNSRVPEYKKAVEKILEKSEEMLNKYRELEQNMVAEMEEIARSFDSQIRDKKHKLVEFNMERNKTEIELDELHERVVSAVRGIQRELQRRLDELQMELKSIKEFTFSNDLIPKLAPLTMVDIEIVTVVFNNGEVTTFPPMLAPNDRFGIPLETKSLSDGFSQYLKELITSMKGSSPTFERSLKMAVDSANLLKKETGLEELASGLNELQMSQLLKEGVREMLIARWEEYGKMEE